MSLRETLYFVRHLRRTFGSVGAVLPTSSSAARALTAELARHAGPKTILEVGAGTGAITAEIVKYLGPHDRLVLCELNPDFAVYLRGRLQRDPAFRRVRERVTLRQMSVTELEGDETFDYIVSSLPFSALPPETTEAALARLRALLKPGGVLSYIEYAYLRALKRHLIPAPQRQQIARAKQVDVALARYLPHQFRRETVWRNAPPTWVRHLRFADAKAQDALALRPLEHLRRLTLGPVSVVSDALPLAAGLTAVALLLRPLAWRWRGLPLLLAAFTGWFLRDPQRRVQGDAEAVYAACDGRVLSVERLHDARFGDRAWLRVAVFLSLADVHVNRAPIAGKVARVFRESGGYAPAAFAQAEHNQACYTVLEGARGPCVVAQRTGLIARRIVHWGSPGHLLAQGERFGFIRFGSRTDIYLPAADVEVCVAPGDHVRAGLSVIARYRANAGTPTG